MKSRCRWIQCLACVLFVAAIGSAGAAENYPNKPGRLILPFGAGGSTDIIGRIFAQRFSEAWGQTIVVDNRPGAAGILGTELAAKASTDGHTIFTYGINQAITAGLHSKLPYNHLRDFTLISLYATMPNILCVTPSLPAANVGEFVKLAKAHPGKFKYASSGIGASPHLTMELFKSVAGVDLLHVPYKVSAQGYPRPFVDSSTARRSVCVCLCLCIPDPVRPPPVHPRPPRVRVRVPVPVHPGPRPSPACSPPPAACACACACASPDSFRSPAFSLPPAACACACACVRPPPLFVPFAPVSPSPPFTFHYVV